jgi:hypothetical protein
MKGFLGLLLLVGLVVVYWKVTLAAVLIWLAVAAVPIAWRELQADRNLERQRLQGLIARADEQHLQASEGDPRGVYGC